MLSVDITSYIFSLSVCCNFHGILYWCRRPTLWEMKQHRGGWEDVKSTSLVSALEISQSQQIPVIEIDKLKVSVINTVFVRMCMRAHIYVRNV